MNQTKQKVLITGGASGIGLALARSFLAHGHAVIIIGRQLSKLEKVMAELPQIYIFQSDVTKGEEVKVLADQLQKDLGGIDVLVNNAGIMNLMDTADETNDLEKVFEEIEINFHSPIRLLHHFLPQLKKSKKASLINVSSGLAYVPFAQSPVYSGTKAAVHFWTQSIRPQLKPYGIKVVELMPPVVDTKLAKDADLKDDNLKPMPPEKLADLFWKDYIKGKEEITPGISKQLKLMSRLAPKFIFNQLNKQAVPSR
jgi:uncharacterized oxidoreductase